jgi:hypothetical protein
METLMIEIMIKVITARLRPHIQDKLSEEYQRCITETNQVLKLSWHIANNNNHYHEEHHSTAATSR